MGKTTQCQRVIDHLNRHGPITQGDCDRWSPKCQRLAARIADLRKKGYLIRSDIEVGKNTAGETVRYARYTLLSEEDLV